MNHSDRPTDDCDLCGKDAVGGLVACEACHEKYQGIRKTLQAISNDLEDYLEGNYVPADHGMSLDRFLGGLRDAADKALASE